MRAAPLVLIKAFGMPNDAFEPYTEKGSSIVWYSFLIQSVGDLTTAMSQYVGN